MRAFVRRFSGRRSIACSLGGIDVGKVVLRDYINATVGFDELGAVTHKSPKSLMRMLGPAGNPDHHIVTPQPEVHRLHRRQSVLSENQAPHPHPLQ